MIKLQTIGEINVLLDDTKKVDYDIDTLITLIYNLISMQKDFNSNKVTENNKNLKKTLVKDIVHQVSNTDASLIDKDFYPILMRYIGELELLTIDTELEYTYNKFDFRLRVKQLESIIYKLIHYNTGKKEKGSIPLNKCLNDLLGFRICLPNFNHNCDVFLEKCRLIEKTYKIRYRNASKGEYRATHIYFYGDSNKNFPWELQIWLPQDYDTNYESHEKHKQDYKDSAGIHKNTVGNKKLNEESLN